MRADPPLRPRTIYLSDDEVAELEREAVEAGRSGLSSQVRWILQQRRQKAG